MREALGSDDEQWFSASRTYRIIGTVALVIAVVAITSTNLFEQAAQFVQARVITPAAAKSVDAAPAKAGPADQASTRRSGSRGELAF